jgi:hypothetical protein
MDYGESFSPVTRISFAAETLIVPEPALPGWEETAARVTAYLTACGVTDATQVEYLIHEIKGRVASRLPLRPDESLLAVAIEETVQLLDDWLTRELKHPHDPRPVLTARAALLSDAVSAWPRDRLRAAPGSTTEAIQATMIMSVPPKNRLVMKSQVIRLRPRSLRRLIRCLLRWRRSRS